MKTVPVLFALLVVALAPVHAQIGITHPSLEALVGSADLVVRGPATKIRLHQSDDRATWSDLTIKVEETLKGPTVDSLTIAVRASPRDLRWTRGIERGDQELWFLVKSETKFSGETEAERKIQSRHQFKFTNYWYRILLENAAPPESSGFPLRSIFTMHFRLLDKPREILAETRKIIATEPKERSRQCSLRIPRFIAYRSGPPGDANSFRVPIDPRLEKVAHALIADSEAVLTNLKADPRWLQFDADQLRAEGAKALRHFRSDRNIEILKTLLDHPAKVGMHGIEEKHYFVRQAAMEVLNEWQVKLEKPVLVEGRDARTPKTDEELRFWLENMIWHHHYDNVEIAAATGIEIDAINAAQDRLRIHRKLKPKRAKDAPLLVLPYPGGRHPRIGFLDGAIRPQRETKVSVFAPWNDESYVVADIPEAIWSNLGLTYLAHTHVPTIWSKRNIEMEKLEWNRRKDGTFDVQRKLPNGIEFGTKVIPKRDAVRMEMWLKNGTKELLTGLRVQNCVMLKGAQGFAGQHNENKVLKNPYVAVHNDDKTRWIITAWDPCDRPWANEKCPCLHSDPKFPDCAPGETKRLRGWLSFYEGKDIEAEFKRIEGTGWRK